MPRATWDADVIRGLSAAVGSKARDARDVRQRFSLATQSLGTRSVFGDSQVVADFQSVQEGSQTALDQVGTSLETISQKLRIIAEAYDSLEGAFKTE